MKTLEYGAEYKYAHDYPEGYAAGEKYLPRELDGSRYYLPVNRGLEIKIQEKLSHLDDLTFSSEWQRYSDDDINE
jgi:putative ATPase